MATSKELAASVLSPVAPEGPLEFFHIDRLRGGKKTHRLPLVELASASKEQVSLIAEPVWATTDIDGLKKIDPTVVGRINQRGIVEGGRRPLGAVEIIIRQQDVRQDYESTIQRLEAFVEGMRDDSTALFLHIKGPSPENLRLMALVAGRLNRCGSTPTSLLIDEKDVALLSDKGIISTLGGIVTSGQDILLTQHGARAMASSMMLDLAYLDDVMAGKCHNSVGRCPLRAPHLDGFDYPLGATPLLGGVAFAIKAPMASSVSLCLFNPGEPPTEVDQISLVHSTEGKWVGFVPGLAPGQLYGYRIDGPYDPGRNLFFNPNHLVVDPNAKALSRGMTRYDPDRFGVPERRSYDADPPAKNNADVAPLAVVVDDDAFDWRGDVRPAFPVENTVIVELHVRGASMRHPGVPEELRGTFAGLSTKAMLDEIQGIGNVVELMPIAAMASEPRLIQMGMINYWGYNPFVFDAFNPDLAAASDPIEQVHELKEMVRSFHERGIKVILDVVFNHTAEGSTRGQGAGPGVSLRGTDGRYYLVDGYGNSIDHTGCGNTINMDHPDAMNRVIGSMRHWVEAYHIDGFRFDLAPISGLSHGRFDPGGEFFQRVLADPILRDCLLVAEPWAIGPMGEGYQVGRFRDPWREWNDRFRDDMRAFWGGFPVGIAAFATRFFGSSDLYQAEHRGPLGGVNFIAAHDGMTFADLRAYEQKHNWANGEHNRDGHGHNLSINCGVEGPTNDPGILALRHRLNRADAATLMLSAGIPMIQLGDAILHTQGGNNNAYCQDNDVSWLDWSSTAGREYLQYVKDLVSFRLSQPALRRTEFMPRQYEDGTEQVVWTNPSGGPVSLEQWHDPYYKTVGVMLALPPSAGNSLFIAICGSNWAHSFRLPSGLGDGKWKLAMDTAHERPFAGGTWVDPGSDYTVGDRSIAVFEFQSGTTL